MADRNAPVGANLGRALRDVGEFYTGTGERPAAGGAYALTPEEERAEAARFMRELQARREARRSEPRQSLITNRPVGGNLAAAQPAARARAAEAAEPPRRSAVNEAAEAERRMNEADADSARAAPASRMRDTERRAPARRARGPARESEADRLNEISLRLARGERPEGPEATNIARRMGIEGYKKGGLIKPKAAAKPVKKAAGGVIPKAKKAPMPKVPGRKPGRPAAMGKPAKPMMPAFKKGGKVTAKKGKR